MLDSSRADDQIFEEEVPEPNSDDDVGADGVVNDKLVKAKKQKAVKGAAKPKAAAKAKK